MASAVYSEGDFVVLQKSTKLCGHIFDVYYKGHSIGVLRSFDAAKAYISRHTKSDLKELDDAIKDLKSSGSNNNQNTKTL